MLLKVVFNQTPEEFEQDKKDSAAWFDKLIKGSRPQHEHDRKHYYE